MKTKEAWRPSNGSLGEHHANTMETNHSGGRVECCHKCRYVYTQVGGVFVGRRPPTCLPPAPCSFKIKVSEAIRKDPYDSKKYTHTVWGLLPGYVFLAFSAGSEWVGLECVIVITLPSAISPSWCFTFRRCFPRIIWLSSVPFSLASCLVDIYIVICIAHA